MRRFTFIASSSGNSCNNWIRNSLYLLLNRWIVINVWDLWIPRFPRALNIGDDNLDGADWHSDDTLTWSGALFNPEISLWYKCVYALDLYVHALFMDGSLDTGGGSSHTATPTASARRQRVSVEDINQVSALFPHIPRNIIEQDLERTGSVPLTCERILSGHVVGVNPCLGVYIFDGQTSQCNYSPPSHHKEHRQASQLWLRQVQQGDLWTRAPWHWTLPCLSRTHRLPRVRLTESLNWGREKSIWFSRQGSSIWTRKHQGKKRSHRRHDDDHCAISHLHQKNVIQYRLHPLYQRHLNITITWLYLPILWVFA